MIRIVRSTIIDAPTDRVWAFLRDFNGHDRWHPAVAKSTIERNQTSDKVGCVRHFFLRDGSELREKLLTLSDLEQTFSYCLLDTPVPLFNYVAHVRLAPVTDGDRTFWDWRCSFTTRPGLEEEMRQMVSEQIYDAGFAAVRAHVTGAATGVRERAVHEHQRQDFPRLADAAGALSQERGARFLGGGTLVMRSVNEADPSIETIVRSTDPALTHIGLSSGRGRAWRRRHDGRDPCRARIVLFASGRTHHRRSRRARGGDRRRQFVCAAALRRFRRGAAGARCDRDARRRIRPARIAARRIS